LTRINDWLNHQSPPTHPDQSAYTRDLKLLVCHLLSKNSAWLYAHSDDLINDHQIQQLNSWAEELKQGKPLAYITGIKEFWTLTLKVNEHTLIPRAETELLIETIQQLSDSPKKILDLGTGSGAIALSLATLFPKAHITASDQSIEALKVAQSNAKLNRIHNVQFIQSNWFDSFTDDSYDIIVSNPPYIDSMDEHLANLSYEPISALVADDHGLSDFKSISQKAYKYLKPGGLLMFEHGWQQSEAVSQILQDVELVNISTQKDLLGHNRITWGYLKT